MSGVLVGRVFDRAEAGDLPDRNVVAVLAVVAEKQHDGPSQTVLIGTRQIAARAGLAHSTAKAALARAVRDGWLTRWSSGRAGRGYASRYQLSPERFSTGADKWPDTGHIEGSEVAAPRPHKSDKWPDPGPQVAGHRPPSVTVETSSSPADPKLPVLVGVAAVDDDEARTAFEGLPGVYSTPAMLAALAVALKERGHTSTTVNRYLRDTCSGGGERPMAVALTNLRAIPANVAPVPDRPDWCGVCDETTRQLDRDGDHPSRCPDCHPASVARPVPKRRTPTAIDAGGMLSRLMAERGAG